MTRTQSDTDTDMQHALFQATATIAPAHNPGGRSKPKWPKDSAISALFGGENDCYRYTLAEVWGAPDATLVMWLMMNPSVASTEHADPTLIKTGKFSRAWGYGGQLIGNVHAYRATDSKRLMGISDPVGPQNDAMLLDMARQASIVVLAYGKPPKPLRPRADRVVGMLRNAGARLAYLKLSEVDGTPWHPLYLPDALKPIVFPDGSLRDE